MYELKNEIKCGFIYFDNLHKELINVYHLSDDKKLAHTRIVTDNKLGVTRTINLEKMSKHLSLYGKCHFSSSEMSSDIDDDFVLRIERV